MNDSFEQLQKQRDTASTKKILKEALQREDQWWRLYKKGLVKYEK